jgi:predicted protein tyrosine phosphatase
VKRPWRKSREDCSKEDAMVASILGQEDWLKMDGRVLQFCLFAREMLARSSEPAEDIKRAYSCADAVLLIATSFGQPESMDAALEEAYNALRKVGLEDALKVVFFQISLGVRGPVHLILPRLWLGGEIAFQKNYAELRRRKITHVVSVMSGEMPQIPEFILGHLRIEIQDRKEAAETLSTRFPEICAFIDGALAEPHSCVYVHCSAGISRGPTAVASYMIWKYGLTAATILRVLKSARPIVRPNLGFVTQLKRWEERTSAAAID